MTRHQPTPIRSTATLANYLLTALLALMCALPAVAAYALALPSPACDPTKQSWAPAPCDPTKQSCTCGPGPGGATCDGSGPASQDGGTGINVGAGNPINIITGNKYQREADMPALPGVLGLEIVRHYNSVFSGPNQSTGLIGRGWKLSYETDLHATGRTVQIVQANGSRIIFNRDPQDPSQCASANPADGKIDINKTQRGDQYTWTWTNGRKLSFNHQGKLVQILALTGEFVSLQHDPKGMLVKVTDPQGRSLQLAYLSPELAKAGDRFRGVQSIDSPVGRFQYGYGSVLPKGSATAAAALLANLVKVSTNNISRIYHYENPQFPTLLTGITVAGAGSDGKPVTQRLATYGYDINGKGILTVKGEPARLQSGKDKSAQPILVEGTGIEQVTLDTGTGGQTIVTNSLGQKTVYRHAIVGGEYRLLEVRGPGCAQCGETNVRYGYDKFGRLTDTTQLSLDGQPLQNMKTELDDYGRTIKVSKIVYRNGKPEPAQWQTRYEYEGGNLQPHLIARPSVVPGQESITRIGYNGKGQATQVTESAWSPAVDGKGQPTVLERSNTYGYSVINGRSLLTQIDGPLKNGPSNSPADSDITQIKYDNRGSYSIEIIAPGNQITKIAQRDEAGRPLQVIAPGGIEFGYEFDALGRIKKLSKAGISEYLSYNALGRLDSVAQSTGQRLNFTYGLDGRLTDIFDAQNNRIRITRDTEGRLIARNLLNPDGSVAQQTDLSRYVADPEAPVNQDTKMGGSSPNIADELTDPNGNTTKVLRGADGLPEAIFEPGNIATRFTYDQMRRLTQLTDAHNIKSGYSYDDFGRLVRVESPDAGTTVFNYDAADHLSSKITGHGTVQAKTLRYRYDAAGRVIEQTAPEGKTTIAYGQAGRPVKIVFPAGEEQYSYDSAARLTVHARMIDGQRFTTRYAYDERGQLKQKTLPDGQILSYHYNGAIHPKAGLLASITRQDLIGQTTLLQGLNDAEDGYANQRYQLAHGLDTIRQLDKSGHIARIGSPGAWEENHQRDAVGQLTQRTPIGAPGIRRTGYTYDPLGRLTGMARTGIPAGDVSALGAQDYSYDPAGNLQAKTLGNRRTSYAIDPYSNRILTAQTEGQLQPYAYNAAGSVTRIGNTSYTWDSQERLVKVNNDAGQPVAEYAYNAFGERIKKISYAHNQKKITYFFYDGSQLVAEAEATEGPVKITRQYVWLEDPGGARPIALLQARDGGIASIAGKALKAIPTKTSQAAGQASQTEVFAIVADHTGAPRAVVNDQKQTVWRAEVTGFGLTIVNASNQIALNLRGSNQYFDEETQLHYNARRYLDPDTGRYLSADPSGHAGGINLYAFAGNNPIANVDPMGLEGKPSGAVPGWTFAEKLQYVIGQVADKYPGELGDALKELVSPTALKATALIFSIWAVGQVAGYGWTADIAIAGLGYLFVGKAVWDVISGIYDSSSLILKAKCEKDLQDAGDILAAGLGKAVAASAGGAAFSGMSKVTKLIKLVFKDSAVAQKAATAAAITQSWFGKFVPGKTRSGDMANAEELALHPGTADKPSYPPWSVLQVTDTWLNPGTKIYMVNEINATNPGGWATPKQFTSLAEARKELSLLEAFKKPGSNCCVLQEYIVKAPIPVREGFAGPLISKDPPYDSYPGGAKQWQLLLDQSLTELGGWKNFLTEGSKVILQ